MPNPGISCVPSTSTTGIPAMSSNLLNPSNVSVGGGVAANVFDDCLNAPPPSLLLFLAGLPAVDGPIPDVDTVLSICLQSKIPVKQTAISPTKQTAISGTRDNLSAVTASNTNNVTGSERSQNTGVKRKDHQRQENDQTAKVQSKPQVMDVFKMRQIQKARAASSQTRSSSYSTSYSGELSNTTRSSQTRSHTGSQTQSSS